MVSSSQKRHAAQGVVAAGMCSQRQACRYLGLARSSWAYVSRPPKPRTVQIGEAIAALAVRHPRYGYRRVHEMLRRQGLRCNLRTVQRMRRDQGLGIKGPARRPKVPVRPDAKVKAASVNDVWCVDVVFDTTQGGNTVKFLTIIDEFSHYCLAIIASRRMGAREVVAALARLVEIHGAPGHLRCDNGAEFIARFLQEWLALADIETRFIEPGSPWQNGINESFNGRFRDECLDRELLANLLEAQSVALTFHHEYNDIRPHSTIDYRTPSEYRAELLNQAPGSGQARQAGPSLRRELAIVPNPNHSLRSNQQPAQSLIVSGPSS
jgi:putative transposase